MRTNQGFEIIQATKVGTKEEVVIGYNRNYKLQPFVCWKCYDGDRYRAGQYYSDLAGAFESYRQRTSLDPEL